MSCEGLCFTIILLKIKVQTIHSPQDTSERDNVYTDEGFARQSNQTLSPAGFLFIAIMCSGDYDPVNIFLNYIF